MKEQKAVERGGSHVQEINGTIFSGNIPVVAVRDGIAAVIHSQLAPLFFRRSKDVCTWLAERAIDSHRTNSRLLKKALRLANRDDVSTALSVNAVTITDNFWFQEENSQLTWEEVRFRENMFDNLALRGDPDSFDQKPSRTPELTNTGSFEKCWRLIDGQWWMYKSGNAQEYFSELFIYQLGKALDFSMAQYEYVDGYVRSLDFTANASVNFEPASALVDDEEDYQHNFELFLQISSDVAKDYLKMIYLDTICKNMDRHTKNYGVLRDTASGRILALAPNYDNNIALISRGYPQSVSRENDGLIRFFETFLKGNIQAKEMLAQMEIPVVTEQLILECINRIPIEVDRAFIIKFILNGQERVRRAIFQD